MAATSIEALAYTAETVNEDIFLGELTDEFVYTSPARNTLNVYLTAAKINQSGAVESVVDINTYDPTTASTFTFDVEKDGYYRFKYAIIPDYDNAVDYAQYDVVYSGGVVYQAFADPSTGTAPPNASFWTVVSDPTDLLDDVDTDEDPGNLLYQLYERILYPFTKVAYGDSSEEAALECCSNCERGEDVKTNEFFAVMIRGMNAADLRGKFIQGEKIARKAEELIETL